jgi:hypothetical protein
MYRLRVGRWQKRIWIIWWWRWTRSILRSRTRRSWRG